MRGRSSPAAAPPPERAVGFASVFYPGTPIESAATIIRLQPGDERSDVDFQLQFVHVSRVQGTVVDPAGKQVDRVDLYLVPAGGSIVGFTDLREAGGSPFTFIGVPPGDHLIVAMSDSQAFAGLKTMTVASGQVSVGGALAHSFAVEPPKPPAESMWATATVRTDGFDIGGLVLTLQPNLTVSGRVVFEATRETPPDLASLNIRLSPIPGTHRLTVGGSRDPASADGSFTIKGLMPGRYLWRFSDASRDFSSRWTIRSIVVNGRNVGHEPLDLAAASLTDVVVTFTDRLTELGGTLQDAAGRAAPDFHILAFSSDRSAWYPESTRVQAVRPSTNGAFLFKGLPPGEYLIAALTDVEKDEWQDPEFLAQLVPAAVRVTITAGQRTVQDLRIQR
jgi:hypothetical protein